MFATIIVYISADLSTIVQQLPMGLQQNGKIVSQKMFDSSKFRIGHS